jgi:acyl-CoA dehydrogenase
MDLVLTDDQSMLANTAREFFASTTGLARLRRLRDSKEPLAYSPDVWKKMVELGFLSMPFPEADGGLGLGLAETVLVTEAIGRELAPEPFVASVVLAAGLLSLRGSADQKRAFLEPAMNGTSRIALAHEEPRARGALALCRSRAAPVPTGYRLTGAKTPVLGGNGADVFLVAARTDGEERDIRGISIFLVPKGTAGLRVEPLARVDSLNAAALELRDVEVSASAIVGDVGDGFSALEQAVDRATVALAGEMLGGMASAFERTLAYLREREQFGAKIGTFQALQHRAARMFIDVELSRSVVMAAARAVDENAPNARALVSVAKARAGDAFVGIANEAIQMHGGIGMTDEHDIGFFLKRAKVAEMTFGDGAFHRTRFATLNGF